ncbi:MAG: adenosine deaminase [Aureispira sp.]|nr:adenosine deaminase [Aureispira sp.]
MRERLAKLPKIELHVHLEACIKRSTIQWLAEKNNISIPDYFGSHEPLFFKTFEDFVEVFWAIGKVIVSEDDFAYVVRDAVEYVRRNNIAYCEISWTPHLYMERGFSFDKTMAIFNAELAKHNAQDQIRFIIDVQRDHGLEEGATVFQKVFDTPNINVVGIGLTGFEEGHPASIFKEVFKKATELGYGCTAHAGEYGDSAEIWRCVSDLGVTRIGHGIRAITDEKLMQFLIENNIHLEISLTSNVRLERVESYAKHPIVDFINKGISVGVNSDDPTVFEIDLLDEYMYFREQCGLSYEQLKKSNYDALEAAFCTDKQKMELKQLLDEAW